MEHGRWWWMAGGLVLMALTASAVTADAELWDDRGHEVLVRNERGANNRESCRYVKGSWSECDPKTNIRSRLLTLKKGDPATCERTKTIQKKCKKACRYEKSAWSDCSASGEMWRTDRLKPNSDPSCDQSRRLTKKCNKNKQLKATKDKATCPHCRANWPRREGRCHKCEAGAVDPEWSYCEICGWRQRGPSGSNEPKCCVTVPNSRK